MAMPEFTMRQLIEAGVHFGHKTGRWNPRMSAYIYGERDGTHIIDLTQTAPMLREALQFVRDTVAGGGRVLFVGTKRQARRPIAETAETGAQYYMNNRWLGGTLTNWKTVSQSIKRLDRIDKTLEQGAEGMTKKERLGLEREQASLQANLGGIRQLTGVPDVLFVIDVKKEALAVAEAKKLGIPIVAIVDTNCVPNGIDYVIPGNDDGARAIALYCRLMLEATLDGMSAQLGSAGVDLGAQEGPPAQAQAKEKGAAKQAGGDGAKPDSVKPDGTKPDGAKPDGAKPDAEAMSAVKVTRSRKSGLGKEVAKSVAAKIAAASAKVMGGGGAAEGAKPESDAAPAGETGADSAATGADSGDAPAMNGAKPDSAKPDAAAGAVADSAAAAADEKPAETEAPASDAPTPDAAKPDAAADAGAGAESADAGSAKAQNDEAPTEAAKDAKPAADADATGGESGDSAEKAATDDAKT